jgi:predicted SAM-dependent methyltransferase
MKLYIGAGKDRKEGYTHLDAYPFEGIDIVADVKQIPLEDSSVDEIYSQDLLEHLKPEDKVPTINELWRILKNGGTMEHYVPNAGSMNDFGSPSHLSHWSLRQFEHFDIDSYRYRIDHEYEGFVGKFQKVLAEYVNWQDEYGHMMPQAIHVIYKAVK